MNGSQTPTVAVCFYPATDQQDYFQLCVGELSLNCKARTLLLPRSFSIWLRVSQADLRGNGLRKNDPRDLISEAEGLERTPGGKTLTNMISDVTWLNPGIRVQSVWWRVDKPEELLPALLYRKLSSSAGET